MYFEILKMKIDLSIYQSILFGDLRPWLDSNRLEDKFKAKLTINFKYPNQTAEAFDDAINKALKDFQGTLNEEDYIFEIESDNEEFKNFPDEILYPLIEINTEEPANNKTSFYYYLIKNEATRLINNLYKLSLLKISEKEKKNTFVSTIKQINATLAKIEQQKIQINKNSSYASNKNNFAILQFLSLTLIRLHLEIKELFEIFVTGNVYDEAGIYQIILKQDAPQQSHIKDTVGLNHYKVSNYIANSKHKKETILEWLLSSIETYLKYFNSEKTDKEVITRKQIILEDLKALENLYFIQLYKIDFENTNYQTLLVSEELEINFNNTFQAITEAIEEHHQPNKRLITVNKEIQKLASLQYDFDTQNIHFLQSIPRRLLEALGATKQFINANLSIDFSKITEPKTPPLKVNLSVGDIALLFRMLSELKPDIFETKYKTYIYKFISANFTTKKSKEGEISVDTISKKFTDPDPKSKEFWVTHLHSLLAFLKKI